MCLIICYKNTLNIIFRFIILSKFAALQLAIDLFIRTFLGKTINSIQ